MPTLVVYRPPQHYLKAMSQAEWEISAAKPKFAISRIASIQAESPANSNTADGFGILVLLWCGRDNVQVELDDSTSSHIFGFTEGEIEISVKNGKISSQERYKQEFFREQIDQKASNTSNKDGKVGGVFGLDLSRFLAGSKLSIEAGGQVSRGSAVVEEKKGEFFRIFWRVVDSRYNAWTCYGQSLSGEIIRHCIVFST